jgi:hypothetical protein
VDVGIGSVARKTYVSRVLPGSTTVTWYRLRWEECEACETFEARSCGNGNEVVYTWRRLEAVLIYCKFDHGSRELCESLIIMLVPFFLLFFLRWGYLAETQSTVSADKSKCEKIQIFFWSGSSTKDAVKFSTGRRWADAKKVSDTDISGAILKRISATNFWG